MSNRKKAAVDEAKIPAPRLRRRCGGTVMMQHIKDIRRVCSVTRKRFIESRKSLQILRCWKYCFKGKLLDIGSGPVQSLFQ